MESTCLPCPFEAQHEDLSFMSPEVLIMVVAHVSTMLIKIIQFLIFR